MENLRINPFSESWEHKGENVSAVEAREIDFDKYISELENLQDNKDINLEKLVTDEDYNVYLEHHDKQEKEQKPVDLKVVEIKERKKKINAKEFFNEKTNRFIPTKLGKYINENMKSFWDGKDIYYYKDGVYVPEGEARIGKVIQDILQEESNSHRKREVIDWIRTNNDIRLSKQTINPNDGYINVRNGLLNLKTRELEEHTSKRISTIQLPITYDPNADDKIVTGFISSVVHKETVELMYEMVGYLLTGDTKAQKAFILHSDGGSGKSVVVEMLQAFIGNGNYSTVAAQDIDSERFSAIKLKGKMLNIVDDMKAQRFSDTGKFKSSVTGGEISVEDKGVSMEIIKPFAKHVFCMNSIPESGDISGAWKDRWIMIPLPYKFRNTKNDDKSLNEKVRTEFARSTLLNKALDGLDRLRDSNYTFSENEYTDNLKGDHFKESDPLQLFTDECCLIEDGQEVTGDSIYLTYKAYCEENGYKEQTLSKIKFNKHLQKQFDLDKPIRPNRNNKKPTWVGIGLLDNDNPFN